MMESPAATRFGSPVAALRAELRAAGCGLHPNLQGFSCKSITCKFPLRRAVSRSEESMSTPYVCSSCSRRLLCHIIPKPQKHQRAWVSSNAFGDLLNEPSAGQALGGSGRYSRYNRPAPRTRDRDGEAKDLEEEHGDQSHTSMEAKRPEEFMSYVSRRGRYSASRAADTTMSEESAHIKTPIRSYAVELEQFLRQKELSKAWAFFLEHYRSKDSPALARPSLGDYQKIRSGRVFQDLLYAMTSTWSRPLRNGSDATPLPNPVEIMDIYEKLGVARPYTYVITIWNLVSALSVAQSKGTDVFTNPLGIQAMHQVMELWSRCIGKPSKRTEHTVTEGEAKDDGPLTSPYAIPLYAGWSRLAHKKHSSPDFQHWLFSFLPKVTNMSGKGALQVTASAVLMRDLLHRGQSKQGGSVEGFDLYLPFAQSVEEILKHTSIQDLRQPLEQMLENEGVASERISEVMHGLIVATDARHLRNLDSYNGQSGLPTEKIIERHITRLGREMEQQNLDAIEKHWHNEKNILMPKPGETKTDPAFRPLFHHFLLAFLSLRQPQIAIEVWNMMVQVGIEPTVQTWTVMMRGCQAGRNVKMVEEMWTRMRNSGLQPDNYAWSTRLNNLFRTHKFREGLQALDEMGREWQAAARKQRTKTTDLATTGDVDGVPKPDIVIINSVLSALASTNQGKEHVPRVLTWSRQFHVEPDVITYNTLINVSLSQDKTQDAIALLQRMTSAGLKPDSTTFTILLSTIFRSGALAEMTPDQQQTHIMSFLHSLESHSLSIDDKGYALLIDRLLKTYTNLPAAHAVLSHMRARGVQPTPHIYTILMTYYFDQTPPDLYSADVLWNQISVANNGGPVPLDVVFYDRMVEAYARHGDVGKMMAFLTRMSKEGKRPGWLAITCVVQCLAERGERERVLEIVRDVHRREGLLSAGLRGLMGQRSFWDYVAGLDVLAELGIGEDVWIENTQGRNSAGMEV
ncbi:hypothetical protein M8818_003302 [Zalaria obscura]|uniref:Uncharacterized protein n=1 Tax=Zalaria obscura TaxID=2024903 RepID=A0ACC3SFE2_9PEZI